MGMGMGFALANQMGKAMAPQAPSSAGGAPASSSPASSSPPGGAPAPPPIPAAVVFHVASGGQPSGPFEMAVIQQKVAAGEITRETLVWKAGMAQWSPAGEVAEMQSAFGAVPPPLPPIG